MPIEEQVKDLQKQLNDINTLLSVLIGTDRYTLQKDLQLFNGRNIIVGTETGTKIGTEATQKLSLYGVTPVVQGSAITTPSLATVSGSGDDTNINNNFTAVKNKIDSIRTALTDLGITAWYNVTKVYAT